MSYDYSINNKKIITKWLIKRGFKPTKNFIMNVLYHKDYNMLDYILHFHPMNDKECQSILYTIQNEAQEAIYDGGDKVLFEQYISDAKRYFS